MYKIVGEKLKQLRKANHLSQEKLSEHIHVSRETISNGNKEFPEQKDIKE
ncbi:helix-turn-helix transcriptional regulator [Streptococcus pasteurianus]|nr:helix-turn-helix transcriptional regulator [Streptococcus pasteurianus]